MSYLASGVKATFWAGPGVVYWAMRIRPLSDIHLEFGDFEPPPVDADVVVLAGDIGAGTRGVLWANRTFPKTPVVYICGNHEYYGGYLPDTTHALRAAANPNVHVLQHEAVAIDGVVFAGVTLWTDMALNKSPRRASMSLRRGMVDYKAIQVNPAADLPGTPPDSPARMLRPSDTIRFHHDGKRWLEQVFEQIHEPLVVVTHHAPSPKSLLLGDKGVIRAAYASQLESFVEASGAKLWLHGHTHKFSDYRLGETRVMCNARGYVGSPAVGFQPELVVEIDA